jgi:glutaminyl-tRNA synthetase
MEDAPRKFFRLKPGGEVRLRYGFWITCHEVVKDDAGEVVELKCTYDPQTRGGDSPPPDEDGTVRKVKGTIHWVSAAHAKPVEVRLYDRLFTAERPGKATDNPIDDLNPDSLEVLDGALIEPCWETTDAERAAGTGAFADGIERFQFERLGYFCVDPDASASHGRPVFNRAVTLKDSWAKAAKKG